MKKIITVLLLFLCFTFLSGQSLYFPPSEDNWETLSLEELGWCADRADSFLAYMDSINTKSFILLKDGKIVFEKYYGTFDSDSLWPWFSAGKSLRAALIGIAQHEGYLSIDDITSDYLGIGWTSLDSVQESKITVRNQLTMTSGLNRSAFDCVTPDCLTYRADAGVEWAYHNGPYNLLKEVLEISTGININPYTRNKIMDPIGAESGFWFSLGNNTFYLSQARDMARFGLLMLANGVWNGEVIFPDSVYAGDMIASSQNLNPAYGYLWWLNGSEFHVLPQGITLPGPMAPSAPSDSYIAAGSKGQFIHVLPTEGIVMVRQGLSSTDELASSTMLQEIWDRLANVIKDDCTVITSDSRFTSDSISICPNPALDIIQLAGVKIGWRIRLIDIQNRVVLEQTNKNNTLDINSLISGLYGALIFNGDKLIYAQKLSIK